MGKLVKTLIVIFTLTLSTHANADLFGRSEEKYTGLGDFKKWNDVVKKNELDMIVNNEVTVRWEQAVAKIKAMNLTKTQQIAMVNDFVNQSIIYADDQTVWGVPDYWTSPTEVFTKGYGDCEDYAIAKYYTLKMLGFGEDEMRLVILKDERKDELHAVLAVDNGQGSYILDNQAESVLPDSQISYYSPIYSINEHNWWKNS